MDSATLKFFDLNALLETRLKTGSSIATSSLPNLQSALRAFLAERELQMDQPVGSVLRASYYRNLRAHVQTLKEQGRPPTYISNRKSLLAQWRRCVIDFDRYCAATLKQATPFQRAILDIFENGVTKKGLARSTGIPLATLNRWSRGNTPNARSLQYVTRLEINLGFTPGTLRDLLPVSAAPEFSPTLAPIAFRERLRQRNIDRYAVTQPSERLKQQWAEFLQFKVSELLADDESDDDSQILHRSKGGRWSSTASPTARPRPSNWAQWFKGRYVATAGVAWTNTSQYLGWLILSEERGGKGLSPDVAQHLAHFLNRYHIRAFVEWKRERAGGIAHQGLLSFLRFASSLSNPRTGYLTQRFRALQQDDKETEETWRAQCKRTFDSIAKLRAELSDDCQPSRNSTEPISAVLALPNPLDAVADMLVRMTAARPATGGIREAVWARDILLIKLTTSNPLRDKNLRGLTYRSDNTGHLRQDKHGTWFIFVPRRELKNHAGAAKDRDYYMPVRKEVWRDIETYLRQYRPLLAKVTTNAVFLTERRGDQFSEDALGERFRVLTKRYLHGCPGVGPHAFRHIVATAILKASPNDWHAAAWALHDREETVRKHYAHLAQHDAAQWMSKAMDGPFSRM